MPLPEIIKRIRDMVAEVPNTGNVFEFRRWITDRVTLEAEFFEPGTETVRFWEVWRRSAARSYTKGNAEITSVQTIVLDGYLGHKDAAESGKAFDLLVEAVIAKFNGNQDLRLNDNVPLAGVEEGEGLPQVVVVNHLQLAKKYLVHHVEITLSVRELTNF